MLEMVKQWERASGQALARLSDDACLLMVDPVSMAIADKIDHHAPQSTLVHITAAMTAGATGTIMTNPLWVVKTRFMVCPLFLSLYSPGPVLHFPPFQTKAKPTIRYDVMVPPLVLS